MALTRWLIKAQRMLRVLSCTEGPSCCISMYVAVLFPLKVSSISEISQSSIKIIFKYRREVPCWREPGENTDFLLYVDNGGR